MADIEFIDMVTFVTGTEFDGTEVGGLSGLAYDANRGVYYVLSDDRSETNPARYYTVDIDVSGGVLQCRFPGHDFSCWTRIASSLETEQLILEGMDLPVPGYNYISTEGDDTSPPIDPFVDRYNPVGKQTPGLAVAG